MEWYSSDMQYSSCDREDGFRVSSFPERLGAHGKEAPPDIASADFNPFAMSSSFSPWLPRVSAETHKENPNTRFSRAGSACFITSSSIISLDSSQDSKITTVSLNSSNDSGYRSRSASPVAFGADMKKVYRGLPHFHELPDPFLTDVNLAQGLNQGNQAVVKNRCPHPGCGRLFKDLKTHKLTHQSERPEKCPIESCEWHRKGFVRKYDKNRHTLTHFKGDLVCIFCPGAGSALQKSFNRADHFKRHLNSVHGAERTLLSRRKLVTDVPQNSTSAAIATESCKCSICSVTIHNAQEFYEHVDSCVLLHIVREQGSSEAVSQQQNVESTGTPKETKNAQQIAEANDKGMFEGWSVWQMSRTGSFSEARTKTRGLTTLSGSDHVELTDIVPMHVSDKILRSDPAQVSSISPMHIEGSLKATAELEEESIQGLDTTPSITSGSESDESQHSLIHGSLEIAVLHSRHQIMVKFMQEVYAIFDRRWTPNTRAHATPASDDGLQYSQNTESAGTAGSSRGAKRGRDERDTSPSDGRRRKRRDNCATPSALKDESQLFACPLHKYDSEKYSCNNITGSKFRTCTGPGFKTIARLKQHLERVHSAPIQCTRCWLVMSDLQAMSDHANQQVRCEGREPKPEGISLDKMRLISSKWGATWADIYSIIFPGAPVPGPYYERNSPSRTLASSPQSKELANFEAYSRTELPRLVEANLQSLVDAEISPLEESLKRMLVDIVRRCQSTVAQNYERIHPASLQERESTSSQVLNTSYLSQAEGINVNGDLSTTARQQLLEQPAHSYESNTTAFFEEPPPQGTNTIDVQPGGYHSISVEQSIDSGYGGELFCTCPSIEEQSIGCSGKHCDRCGLECFDAYWDSNTLVL